MRSGGTKIGGGLDLGAGGSVSDRRAAWKSSILSTSNSNPHLAAEWRRRMIGEWV